MKDDKMIKASITFYSNKRDENGLTKPFNNYLGIASTDAENYSSVASVIPLYANAPLPSPPHIFKFKGR